MNSSYSETVAQPFNYPAAGIPHSIRQSLPWQPAVEESPENLEVRLARARIEGRAEGEVAARAQLDQELQQIRCALGTAIHEFAEQRAQHLRALEGEAVKLSLAIARRVIRRESQIDPGLLLGLVRSALAELEQTSTIRLRVRSNVVDEWRHHFQVAHPRETTPEIIADDKLSDHECRIESSIGTTELSLESTLAEIETGLFDLLSSAVRAENSPTRTLQ